MGGARRPVRVGHPAHRSLPRSSRSLSAPRGRWRTPSATTKPRRSPRARCVGRRHDPRGLHRLPPAPLHDRHRPPRTAFNGPTSIANLIPELRPCRGSSAFYVIAMLALGLHLYHGVWSSFRSLGSTRPSPNPLQPPVATVVAVARCGSVHLHSAGRSTPGSWVADAVLDARVPGGPLAREVGRSTSSR